MSHGRGFRNLQRLVLSSNKDASEVDIGLLLLAGQQSLNQVALQMLHTRNSLFEGLYHAGAEFPRLESLTLGRLIIIMLSQYTCVSCRDSFELCVSKYSNKYIIINYC